MAMVGGAALLALSLTANGPDALTGWGLAGEPAR